MLQKCTKNNSVGFRILLFKLLSIWILSIATLLLFRITESKQKISVTKQGDQAGSIISAVGLFCCDKFEETPNEKVINMSKLTKTYFIFMR